MPMKLRRGEKPRACNFQNGVVEWDGCGRETQHRKQTIKRKA
ncbi:hypothetical protein [Ruminococcus callidus]|nr:hypothetical protein [Ruminococcus callidus]